MYLCIAWSSRSFAVDWFVEVEHLSSGVYQAALLFGCLSMGHGIHLVQDLKVFATAQATWLSEIPLDS